jgi:hypothetical protein
MQQGYDFNKDKFSKQAAPQINLNQRNRAANTLSDIQASQKRAEKEAAAELMATKSGKKDLGVSLDPFGRRETRPSIIWNTSGTLGVKKNAPAPPVIAVPLTIVVEPSNPTSPASKVSTPVSTPLGRQPSTTGVVTDAAELEAAFGSKYLLFDDLDISKIRDRVVARLGLGVDPLIAASESIANAKARYLKSVCGHLPPLGSKERENMRKGVNLASIIDSSRNAQ